MKTWMKAMFCIVLSFSFLFISLGYAALSDTLSIEGKAKIDIPAGIYIISMEKDSSSRLDVESSTYYPYSTTIDSSLSKSDQRREGTVTYKITLFNNTQYEYAYRDIYYQQDLESNGYIGNGITVSCSLDSASATEKKIAPGATKELTVTYKLNRSTSINYNKTYRNIVNIRFGINVDSLEQAHDVLLGKFAEILNSASGYAELTDKIDDKFDGKREWTSNFIGNVAGASNADSVTISNLFGGRLEMVIGAEQQTVTAMIKHEDVDGDETTGDSYTLTFNDGSQVTHSGCEYTLYLTTESLKANTTATVYAAVYTCDQNADGTCGEWYMKGLLFEGTAQVVGYMGSYAAGSFDTGTWRSVAKTYVLSENNSFSVSVPQGQTIQEVTQTVDTNAAQVLQELLTKAKTYLDSDQYAGTGLEALEEAYNDARPYFTVTEDGTIIVDEGHALSELVKHIDALSWALKAFENVPS